MEKHPITPPPVLVQQWTNSAHLSQPNMGAICREVATQAARWGANQELEACIQLMLDKGWITQSFAENLRTARRPKQPSLKEKALKALDAITTNFHVHEPDAAAVRRALESLPDGPAVTPPAAVLRAAVEQIKCNDLEGPRDQWEHGFFAGVKSAEHGLLAIATELEGHQ